MSITVDQVVAAYIRLRDLKAKIQAEADEKINECTTQMQTLEAWLKEKSDELNVTQFKTPHGVAFFKTVDFASLNNWDSFIDFVKSNGAYDMLEKRVSKTAVRAYLDNTQQLPPGVNYGTRLSLNIRRAANTDTRED